MIGNAELKEKARQQLQGNWVTAVIALIVLSVAMSVLSVTVIGTLVAYGPLEAGMCILALKWAKGEKADLAAYFDGMKINLVNTIIAGVIISLLVAIGMFLFIVPGVIVALMFFPVIYLLVENPEMDWKTALQKSKTMMDGHMMEAFMLGLSFIGWFLLTIVTCGLAGYYMGPYMKQAFVNFYLELKNAAPAAAAAAPEAPASPAADSGSENV